MFCKYCGAQIHDNDASCPYCGAPQEATSAYSTYNEATNEKAGETSYNNNSGPNYENAGAAIPNYNASYSGMRLKTDRSLVMFILLTIVTCGIYSYYYIYKLAHDVNIACEGDGEKTAGLIEFLLLSFITCGIYSYIWYYKLGERLQKNAPRYGLTFSEGGTAILVWIIFGSFLCGIGPFVALHIINKNTNCICEAYNIYNNL